MLLTAVASHQTDGQDAGSASIELDRRTRSVDDGVQAAAGEEGDVAADGREGLAFADRERLRERGRARVAVFSWDKCAAQTLALYRTVVAS